MVDSLSGAEVIDSGGISGIPGPLPTGVDERACVALSPTLRSIDRVLGGELMPVLAMRLPGLPMRVVIYQVIVVGGVRIPPQVAEAVVVVIAVVVARYEPLGAGPDERLQDKGVNPLRDPPAQ